MTDKQIKTRIGKLNKKLQKTIDKFTSSIEQISIEFKDLFPTMTIDDFKDKTSEFKSMLEQAILTPEDAYESVVEEIHKALSDSSDSNDSNESSDSNDSNDSNESKRSTKIEVINIG